MASNTARTREQPRALAQHPTTLKRGEDGRYVAWLPDLDPIRSNRLALIVVRLDAEGTGEYTIGLDAMPRASK